MGGAKKNWCSSAVTNVHSQTSTELRRFRKDIQTSSEFLSNCRLSKFFTSLFPSLSSFNKRTFYFDPKLVKFTKKQSQLHWSPKQEHKQRSENVKMFTTRRAKVRKVCMNLHKLVSERQREMKWNQQRRNRLARSRIFRKKRLLEMSFLPSNLCAFHYGNEWQFQRLHAAEIFFYLQHLLKRLATHTLWCFQGHAWNFNRFSFSFSPPRNVVLVVSSSLKEKWNKIKFLWLNSDSSISIFVLALPTSKNSCNL